VSDDPNALSLATSDDVADALAFAQRFQGRKRVHNADEVMSAIVAKRLVEHLERSGFVVMKRRPIGGGGCARSRLRGVSIRSAAIVFAFGIATACAQEVHYSPDERLDAIDAGLIATAKQTIDLASYALTDGIVLDALNDAERRGVAIRIVLDPRERHDFAKLGDLSDNVRPATYST
jgi:phosphatidylserine/phosphatidylglycerophosphate/cardiolipin synthase-like enzyme